MVQMVVSLSLGFIFIFIFIFFFSKLISKLRATYPIKLGSFKVKIVSRDGENYAGIGLTTLESFQDLSGHTKIIGTK